jgi:hypothetical protein
MKAEKKGRLKREEGGKMEAEREEGLGNVS